MPAAENGRRSYRSWYGCSISNISGDQYQARFLIQFTSGLRPGACVSYPSFFFRCTPWPLSRTVGSTATPLLSTRLDRIPTGFGLCRIPKLLFSDRFAELKTWFACPSHHKRPRRSRPVSTNGLASADPAQGRRAGRLPCPGSNLHLVAMHHLTAAAEPPFRCLPSSTCRDVAFARYVPWALGRKQLRNNAGVRTLDRAHHCGMSAPPAS